MQIPFPVIADRTGEISRLYGMIAPMASNSETVRNDISYKLELYHQLKNGYINTEIGNIINMIEALD